MERLSSGFRINRAADDAAGLAVSEKLQAQIGGLNQASRNSQDGVSMIQTAEGALDEVQSMMQRMRDLAVQASSDTNSQTERDNINLELNQLGQEINSISMRTKFNGQSLLSGSLTKAQGAAAPASAPNTGAELTKGTVVAGANAGAIGSISVDGAQAGRNFQLTGAVANGTIPATLTLTMYDTSGTAMNMTDANGKQMAVAQTINVADIAANGSETLNFSNLGVSITVNAGAGGALTGSEISAMGSSGSIDTLTASGTATLQSGANQGDSTDVAFVNTSLGGGTGIAAMDTLAATLNTFNGAAGRTRDNATSLITALDTALGSISSSRATLGAAQNRLQHTIANLGTTSENLSASNSRIRDVDVATESSNMAKNQVLEQAGVSVLAQANQLPQLALKLLG
jgi:flagellin